MKAGLRWPTDTEVFLGLGLGFGVTVIVVDPILKDHWTSGWQHPALFGCMVVAGIISAMRLKDAQRRSRIERLLERPALHGDFAELVCACRHVHGVRPGKSEDILIKCQGCNRWLGLGRDSRGDLVAYQTEDSSRF